MQILISQIHFFLFFLAEEQAQNFKHLRAEIKDTDRVLVNCPTKVSLKNNTFSNAISGQCHMKVSYGDASDTGKWHGRW